MKKILLFSCITLFTQISFSNPSFTIGSNQYLTIFAYPHDLLRWPENGLYFNYSSQKLPWHGNVTDINARPSESYVNNYQHIEFATPADYTGNPADVHSWMMTSGYAKKRYYGIGGLYTAKFGKFLGEIGITSINMELYAEGVGRADEDGTYHMVPFKGETMGKQYDYEVKLIYATRLYDNPFGFKINYFRKNSKQPEGYLIFHREDTTYATPHLTWGWANFSCAHIFGYSHMNADAFYQNSYSVMDGNRIDLQASYEFSGNYKTGLRFRSVSNVGDDYHWTYLNGSDVDGYYELDPDWKSKHTEWFIRGYSKARFIRKGDLDAGILFFLQYGENESYHVNRHSESEPNSIEGEKQLIIETNPFFNLKFDRGYIDFGLLIEGAYSRLKNIRTAWNSSISGEEEVLWSTSPYEGWSTSWENFSKGHNMFFATGCETYSSINVYKRLSFQAGITFLKKFSHIRKVYGEAYVPDEGGNYAFHETNLRVDKKNETWMTGNLGLTFGRGPVQFIGIFQLPLAYLNKRKTQLEEDDVVLFEHEKRNVWQVQKPASLRLLVVCSLGKPPQH